MHNFKIFEAIFHKATDILENMLNIGNFASMISANFVSVLWLFKLYVSLYLYVCIKSYVLVHVLAEIQGKCANTFCHLQVNLCPNYASKNDFWTGLKIAAVFKNWTVFLVSSLTLALHPRCACNAGSQLSSLAFGHKNVDQRRSPADCCCGTGTIWDHCGPFWSLYRLLPLDPFHP